MKNIFCIGKISDAVKKQFESKDFQVTTFVNSNDFSVELKITNPFLILIEDNRFKEVRNLIQQKIPFIVFTWKEQNIEGYDFFRNGALDYFSCANEGFASLVLNKIESSLSLNKNNFLDKILQESESLYYSIIENSPIIILVCNSDGQIIISNQHAKNLMNLKEENDNIYNYLDPVLADDFLRSLKVFQNSHQNNKFKCSIIKNKIDLTPIMWHLSFFDHVLDNTIVVFGEDISAYEEMRKKEFYQTKSLLVLNERLERVNKSLDQFSRMISHDLKNGLNRIIGFTRILSQNEVANISKESHEIIERILQNTDEMVLTINRILDFAKSKGSNIQVRNFLVNDLLQKVLTDFEIQMKDVKGHYEFESEDIEIEADIICLKQVFENLISNAIKYRSHEREFLLKISLVDLGADILIIFEDNGIGIKPGDEEKLFNEFYRNQDIENKIEGHGIGLSNVKTLLDSHGGVIWVDPKVSIGSSFNIQLPKKQ